MVFGSFDFVFPEIKSPVMDIAGNKPKFEHIKKRHQRISSL